MDDPQDAETETERTPYMRLPWPLVAVGLLGVLAVVLAIGLFANRYLRPQVGLVPTPVAAAAPPNTSDATPPIAAPPTIAPPRATAATPAVAIATSQPTPTALAQPLASPTASPAAITVAATPTPSADSSPTLQPLPTVEPALADEVGRAYVMFWRVRSQALLELDSTHLSEVMGGDYLQNFIARLDDLQLQGRAIKTQIVLNYTIAQATHDAATVIDRLEDSSFYIVPGTEEPLSEQVSDVLLIEFKLVRTGEVWKVVDSVRQN